MKRDDSLTGHEHLKDIYRKHVNIQSAWIFEGHKHLKDMTAEGRDINA